MTLILLLACTDTSIELEPTDDTADTALEEEEVEPSVEDWEGDWVGSIVLDAFGDGYFDGCEGEIELDFDDDGDVDGDANCDYTERDYELEFEGEVDAEGNLVGTMTIEFIYAPDTEVTVTGAAEDEDHIQAVFEGTYSYSSWGTDYDYDIGGTINLERD
jgi:hypothetical protein